jgi:phage terminase small subunit
MPAAGYAPGGKKAADAPAEWPFGTVDPAPAAAPVAPQPIAAPGETLTALALFQAIYRDETVEMKARLAAAREALPFEAARPAAVGKKDAKNDAAKKAASKFATPGAPPKLAAVAGKKV